MNFNLFREQWRSFWNTPFGKVLAKAIRYGFAAGIIAFLLYQITEIGWGRVWESLPVTPWFYILLLLLYFALPVSEQFIYRLSLNFSFWEGFRVFIQKKIYNADVLGYSGEAYFYFWGKKHLGEDDGYILRIIKDNNILSSITSTLTAIVLLSIFLYVGRVNLGELFDISRVTVILIIFIAILAISLLFIFRRHIIFMDMNTALKIFGIHQARLLFVYTLEIVQWMVVLPEVPLYIWFTFISVRIIASRIPFLPNQDMVFVAASLEVSKYLAVSEAAIAGIMLTSNVLTKVMNIVLFSIFSFSGKNVITTEETAPGEAGYKA